MNLRCQVSNISLELLSEVLNLRFEFLFKVLNIGFEFLSKVLNLRFEVLFTVLTIRFEFINRLIYSLDILNPSIFLFNQATAPMIAKMIGTTILNQFSVPLGFLADWLFSAKAFTTLARSVVTLVRLSMLCRKSS